LASRNSPVRAGGGKAREITRVFVSPLLVWCVLGCGQFNRVRAPHEQALRYDVTGEQQQERG